MKRLYGVTQDYFFKPLVGLALIVGMNSFSKADSIPKSREKNYFTNYGFIDELDLLYSSNVLDDLEISLGDMDGDGDLDIIVGSRVTGLRIYENRISQKK